MPWRSGIILVALLTACATPPTITERRDPSALCDFRVADLNARLCERRGGTYVLGSTGCGACVLPHERTPGATIP